MIYYSTCLRGRSHIKNNKPCQDYKKIYELANNFVVAAVADGVGSSKHSNLASKIAVNVSMEFIKNNFPKNPNKQNLKKLILSSFNEAQDQIEFVCQEKNDDIYEYDTTLTLIIYDGATVFYGQSGDSGAIGITNAGDYIKITSQQKGKDGISVIPLRFREKTWKFGCLDDKFCAIMLATDGVLDGLISPPILRREECPIYVSLVKNFLDLNFLQINKQNVKKFTKNINHFLKSDQCKNISDDMTIVGIINENIIPNKKEESYYDEPDWEFLSKKIKRILYPHLYEGNIKEMSDD